MEFSITGDPCLPSHDAFSFCAETIQPVMLYELGFQAARGAVLVVGSHLHYERRRDVVAQLARARRHRARLAPGDGPRGREAAARHRRSAVQPTLTARAGPATRLAWSAHASAVLGWVKPFRRKNFRGRRNVLPGMRQINDAHVALPGLAVMEVAAADDETAFAIQKLLAGRCDIPPADRTTREPGEPGVRLRCFLDLQPDPDT